MASVPDTRQSADLPIRILAYGPDMLHCSTNQMACLAQLDSDMTRLVDAQSEDPRDSGARCHMLVCIRT